MSNIDIAYLKQLKQSWTAQVELKNGSKITIWYTALPTTQNTIKRIISVASDYPRHNITITQ